MSSKRGVKTFLPLVTLLRCTGKTSQVHLILVVNSTHLTMILVQPVHSVPDVARRVGSPAYPSDQYLRILLQVVWLIDVYLKPWIVFLFIPFVDHSHSSPFLLCHFFSHVFTDHPLGSCKDIGISVLYAHGKLPFARRVSHISPGTSKGLDTHTLLFVLLLTISIREDAWCVQKLKAIFTDVRQLGRIT